MGALATLTRGPLAPPLASHAHLCATPDILLKYPDAIFATYNRRQMRHLKHVSETLAKTREKHLKTVVTHSQHPDKTFTTYV